MESCQVVLEFGTRSAGLYSQHLFLYLGLGCSGVAGSCLFWDEERLWAWGSEVMG